MVPVEGCTGQVRSCLSFVVYIIFIMRIYSDGSLAVEKCLLRPILFFYTVLEHLKPETRHEPPVVLRTQPDL